MENFLYNTYWGGLTVMAMGVFQLFYTVKLTPKKKNSALRPYTSGIVGGLSFLIAGIVMFIMKIVR